MLIVSLLMFVVGLLSLIISAYIFISKKERNASIVILSSLTLMIAGAIVAPVSLMTHGATFDDFKRYSIADLVYHYENTPEDQSGIVSVKQEDGTIDDCLLVFYKFDCPDCTASYKNINDLLSNSGREYYWVESRSDLGSQLSDEYGIWWVPSVALCYEGDKVIQCNHREVNEDGNTNVVLEEDFVDYFKNMKRGNDV